ncbi:MAG TPA: hypothetical protein DCW97_05280 [Acidobacteria bacterium]|nr:hypothetical protein [Acidobacteriota bacterium]
MKKLLFILTGVVILFLSSLIYREKVTPITTNFPIGQLEQESSSEIKLNLILFFSIKNCFPCLKVIEILNNPPDGMRVIGIVPERELPSLCQIRQITGARFPIYSSTRLRKYCPIYAPTLYGIGPDGTIYFMLSCVGIEETYLRGYLSEFMQKASYLLIEQRRR